MLLPIVICSKHFRKDSDLLGRIVKRNEGLHCSCACGTLEQKEKRFVVQKKIFRGTADKPEHVAECRTRKPWKTFFAALVIQTTTTAQLLFYTFVYARRHFLKVLKLAFLSVITGWSRCLVTNQCCHFWYFKVRSVVLREICEVWCFANKVDLDLEKLFLFSTFPLLLGHK